MKIRLILTGRSYHTAAALPAELDLADGATLQDAIRSVNELLPDDAPLPASCLIAVGGQHVGIVGAMKDRPLHDGEELTLVAPVAGG